MHILPPEPRAVLEAMERTITEIDPWLPRRALASLKRRWVHVEREVLRMQTEIDALRGVPQPTGEDFVP